MGEEARYVSGMKIRTHIPNLSSIPASFTDYAEVSGIREVPLEMFDLGDQPSARVKDLAEQIRVNNEINPLIVAIDSESKPYILEGGHRVDALKLLGKKSFPAKIVIDTPSTANADLVAQVKGFNRLMSSPYLGAISALPQAVEHALPPKTDQPSALERYYSQEANPAMDNFFNGVRGFLNWSKK